MNKIKRLVQFLSIDLWRLDHYSSKRQKGHSVFSNEDVMLCRLCFQRQLKVQAWVLDLLYIFETILILHLFLPLVVVFLVWTNISQFLSNSFLIQ